MLFSLPTFKDEASHSYRKTRQVGALGAVGRIGSPSLNGSQETGQEPKQYAKVGALGMGRVCKPTLKRQVKESNW